MRLNNKPIVPNKIRVDLRLILKDIQASPSDLSTLKCGIQSIFIDDSSSSSVDDKDTVFHKRELFVGKEANGFGVEGAVDGYYIGGLEKVFKCGALCCVAGGFFVGGELVRL
jgi:hypothetical protein